MRTFFCVSGSEPGGTRLSDVSERFSSFRGGSRDGGGGPGEGGARVRVARRPPRPPVSVAAAVAAKSKPREEQREVLEQRAAGLVVVVRAGPVVRLPAPRGKGGAEKRRSPHAATVTPGARSAAQSRSARRERRGAGPPRGRSARPRAARERLVALQDLEPAQAGDPPTRAARRGVTRAFKVTSGFSSRNAFVRVSAAQDASRGPQNLLRVRRLLHEHEGVAHGRRAAGARRGRRRVARARPRHRRRPLSSQPAKRARRLSWRRRAVFTRAAQRERRRRGAQGARTRTQRPRPGGPAAREDGRGDAPSRFHPRFRRGRLSRRSARRSARRASSRGTLVFLRVSERLRARLALLVGILFGRWRRIRPRPHEGDAFRSRAEQRRRRAGPPRRRRRGLSPDRRRGLRGRRLDGLLSLRGHRDLSRPARALCALPATARTREARVRSLGMSR